MTEILKHIEKAAHCIDTIERLDTSKDAEVIINRCYYCIFHCATALLLSKGMHTKTHAGLLKTFSEVFVKSKILDLEFYKIASTAFNLRQSADYEVDFDASSIDISALLLSSKFFLSTTTDFLKNETD